MQAGVDDRRRDLLEQIARCMEEGAASRRTELAETFVRQLYANVPPEDLFSGDPVNLCGAAIALWDFAARREAATPLVRVYNPRRDTHGWTSSHTIVEVVQEDMPFLVDSVCAALDAFQTDIHLVIHPIVGVERDGEGQITHLAGVGEPAPGARTESWMHIQIGEQPGAMHEDIRRSILRVLQEVRAAVTDWPAMRTRCLEAARRLRETPPLLPREQVEEACSFLEWLADDNFTFLGCREYVFRGEGEDTDVEVREGRGLGILRDENMTVFGGIRRPGAVPARVWERIRQPEVLRITKANRRSRVHRPVYMDTIAVKWIDEDGVDRSESLFVGLFTSEAYSRNPRNIPLLRRKVEGVMSRAGFVPGSHDARTLRHIVETYPRDELFQIDEDELHDMAIDILHLQERKRIALFVRQDPFERFVSCLIYVPRERYDTSLRHRLQAIVEETYQGKVRDFYILLTDAPLGRLRFTVQCRPGRIPEVDTADLERRLREAGRSWLDRLETALVDDRGEEEGLRTLRRFQDAFPVGYWERFGAEAAVEDIGHLERALVQGEVGIQLYRLPGASPHDLQLKVYNARRPAPLSEIVPILEDMGLVVNAERPYEVRLPDVDEPLWIRDFDIATSDAVAVAIDEIKEVFEEALSAVLQGHVEDDGFNGLVLRAGLTSRQVTILRAYARYLRQVRVPFSHEYLEQTLTRRPEIARLLVELFEVRFDPASRKGADERAAAIVSRIRELLDDVDNLDQDRMIRRFLNLVESTLRTNYFQRDAAGEAATHLSVKLDSQAVRDLPLPRPFREIFVYSPRVEGIHLRGGLVARGGIRWSDRKEDFRTEVLGLMKAQMVKNAVIVPVGSKGGFVVKRPPPEAGDALRAEVAACYRIFIRGLLDLTDNRREDEIVPPPDVVRHDEDDTYLVVAADKGTATFSDMANELAAERGFWLDDAFASGGSAGYDHKKVGITARGAWEGVKRHFRELGKDIQSEAFTVVGVGDMSGDVFGNGMLLSPHIRLLAAFNHLHVFVDPDPDPAAGFAERQRLFDLERSGWDDYDPAAISTGGGVFSRTAKSIPITPEMKRAFGIEEDVLTPSELIRVLLTTDAELLWFGGIGTFVKAASEPHADAGDRANDAVRVDGRELQAAVVAEGANLAMTQAARIEYALRGGRLNTDAIDNSAGVDCSDHEVNIKILLGDPMRAGEMDRGERNELLREMTEEVARLSLRANYLQTQALSVTHRMSLHLLDRLARFMRELEKDQRLDRTIERLPDDEAVADRLARGDGLTRPELALLLSHAKIELNDELLASELPDDPALDGELQAYFPAPLRERFADAIRRHRLRREIIATVLTNEIINRVGISFLHEVREKTSASAAEVARAFLVSRDTLRMPQLWGRIEALDTKVSAEVQAEMLTECGRMIERGTVWCLRQLEGPIDLRRETEAFQAGVQEFTEAFEAFVSPGDLVSFSTRRDAYASEGVPKDLARRVAQLAFLAPAFDIVRLSADADRPVRDVAQLYFSVGSRFGMDWLRQAAGRLSTDTAWDKRAVSAIVEDLYGHQSELTRAILAHAAEGARPEDEIDAWARPRERIVARTEQLLAELQSVGGPNLSMLAVANRQLKSMIA